MRAITALSLATLFSICAMACGTPDVSPFDPDTNGGAQRNTGTADEGESTATQNDTKTPSNTAPVVTPSTPTTPTAATTPAPDTTWTGTLAKTEAVAFGGAPYCNYKTHFENITVRITMNGDGSVKFADVNGNAVEETVGTCSNKPIAENTHDYAFTPAAPVAGSTFQASGGAANQPHAMLNASVAVTTDGHVTLTWHRDDIGSPFDWTITADVPLTKE